MPLAPVSTASRSKPTPSSSTITATPSVPKTSPTRTEDARACCATLVSASWTILISCTLTGRQLAAVVEHAQGGAQVGGGGDPVQLHPDRLVEGARGGHAVPAGTPHRPPARAARPRPRSGRRRCRRPPAIRRGRNAEPPAAAAWPWPDRGRTCRAPPASSAPARPQRPPAGYVGRPHACESWRSRSRRARRTRRVGGRRRRRSAALRRRTRSGLRSTVPPG